MSLERRIENAEQTIESTGAATLHEAGLSDDRIAEVTEAGSIVWDRLTDDELNAVCETGPDTVAGVPWSELTDEQLRRIAAGEEPPEEVVHGPS